MYKVVVVEDEEIARKGIIFTINWDALNCMIAGEAANGEEGAEVIRRLSPDIIVTDLKMPRMDGVEMIAKLRDQGKKETGSGRKKRKKRLFSGLMQTEKQKISM